MNANELRELLKQLSSAALQMLSTKEIMALAKNLKKFKDKIERVELTGEINKTMATIPEQEKALLLDFLKKASLKNPAKTASAATLQNHLSVLLKIMNKFNVHIKELRELLKHLTSADEDKAISEITRLNKEQKKSLSKLANLTKRTAKGVRSFNIGSSAKSNKEWLQEVKKNKTTTILG